MILLKKTKIFAWNEKCGEAFQSLKVTLATSPFLLKLDTNKKLIVYLSVSFEAIGMELMQEEGNELRLLYFVSQVLWDLYMRYPMMEKVAFALFNVAHCLRRYF